LTTKQKKLSCPECGELFNYPKTLGSHRRVAHGVAGSSPSSLRAQRLRALSPLPEGPFPCPECGYKAVSQAGLTIHQKAKHSAAVVARRVAASAIDKNRGSFPCDQCDFVAAWIGGLKLHIRTKHKSAAKPERSTALVTSTVSEVNAIASTRNGHVRAQADARRSADTPEALIAFTAGRVQELCAVAASQFDLPSKPFTARVIELIYATTLR
jgi:predicted RNA-binding Zn-ribbon protein involved in translation (DUF1610 family)